MLLATIAAVSGAFASSASAADEAFGTSVSISATSPTTQKSGSLFTYEIEYTCFGARRRRSVRGLRDRDSPRRPDRHLLRRGAARGDVRGHACRQHARRLRRRAEDLPRHGAARQRQPAAEVPPRPTTPTPDGTELEVPPRRPPPPTRRRTRKSCERGRPPPPSTTPIQQVGPVGGAFAEKPGEAVTYKIQVACTQPGTGTILAESMKVTDALPAGLAYVSADHGATESGGTITWNFPAAGNPCRQAAPTRADPEACR